MGIMAVAEKQAAILNCIGVGLSYSQAEILAECTAEEAEELAADSAFQARVKFKQESLKRTLLQRIMDASALNAAVGSTTETRWLLSKLDKERFGDGAGAGDVGTRQPEDVVHVYLPDNGRDRP